MPSGTMSRFQRTPDPDRSGQMLLEAGEPVGLVYWSHDYTDREGTGWFLALLEPDGEEADEPAFRLDVAADVDALVADRALSRGDWLARARRARHGPRRARRGRGRFDVRSSLRPVVYLRRCMPLFQRFQTRTGSGQMLLDAGPPVGPVVLVPRPRAIAAHRLVPAACSSPTARRTRAAVPPRRRRRRRLPPRRRSPRAATGSPRETLELVTAHAALAAAEVASPTPSTDR